MQRVECRITSFIPGSHFVHRRLNSPMLLVKLDFDVSVVLDEQSQSFDLALDT